MLKKLFIVDDNKTLRKCYIKYIVACRNIYEIREASSGLEAQKVLFEEKYKPDCMMLDNEMPGGIMGIDLLRKMHKENLIERINLIMCSGSITKQLEEEIRSYGVKILKKPFMLQNLMECFDNNY